MNDFFTGTPELSEERRLELEQELQESLPSEVEPEQPKEAAPQPQQASQPQKASQPQQAPQPPTTSEVPEIEKEKNESFYGYNPTFQDDGIAPTTGQQIAEGLLALPTGAVDFVVDTFNLVPGVDLPKIPEFENEVLQTVRELGSVVLPTVGLTASGVGLGAAAAKGSKIKFLADPIIRRLGTISYSAGAGAFVDYTVEFNQTDDNLAGTLKKNWPTWYGWVPDDLATLDYDSPDVKRAKNVTEGMYLGVGTDVLLGVAKLIGGAKKLRNVAIPENEKARKVLEKIKVPDDPEEVVSHSTNTRLEAMDEVGKYNFDKSVELKGSVEEALKDPIPFVHDLYGPEEMGIRGVDTHISIAGVDSYRIRNNVDSIDGRVGSMASDSFIKKGLDLSEDGQKQIKKFATELKTTKFGYKDASGTYHTAKQIAEDGDLLAEDVHRMPIREMKAMLEKELTEKSGELGVTTLSSTGIEATRKLIKRYANDLMNMDELKAAAYLETSMAGQVADMARGMRLVEGTAAVERAQEQIIDRLEYLLAMRGRSVYVRGRALNMVNMWQRITTDPTKLNAKQYADRIQRLLADETNDTLRAIEAIRYDASVSADTLRELSQKNPEMIAPLMMAYDFTDGNVDTIAKLNRFLQNSTGTLSKAFIDTEPEIPSVILGGMWSNIYNATLSAIATPIKAGASNIAGLVEKPIGAAIGALREGDMQLLRRGWYQYTINLETLQNAFDYMGRVFARSATEGDVGGLQRENFFVKNQKQIEILEAIANAKDAAGDSGPLVVVEQIKAMQALAEHPWLRFGNRAMQALDGFTQAMIAQAEARGRIFDELTQNGAKEFTGEDVLTHAKKVYDEMFDETNLINDKVVKQIAGEIALNLDNAANDAFSNLIKRAPILKPFFLFTKTPLNELKLTYSYSPHHNFIRDIQAFRGKADVVAQSDMEKLLKSRKIDVNNMSSEDIYHKYREVRADLYGRSALGQLMVSAGIGLALTDRLTGNGLYDKEKQKLRQSIGWKPRSIRLPGGEWVSYDNLGPVTNFLALIADIADQIDVLAPNEIGEHFHKLMYVVGASITDKTYLQGVQPFMDILRGDIKQVTRWTGATVRNASLPGASLMAELGRLMDPGLKEVEANMIDQARERLPVYRGQLPKQYDWIDGGEVGVPDNMLARVWNTYMPWKVNGELSDEKKFLQMIEYDARPILRTNGKGYVYTAEERSEISRILGEKGFFKEVIQEIMQSYPAKEFRKDYKEMAALGFDAASSDYTRLYDALDKGLRDSIRRATLYMTNADDITFKTNAQSILEDILQEGDTEEAQKFMEEMKKFSQ